MKTILTVKTGKGEFSTPSDIDKTERKVMEMAGFIGGEVLSARYLPDGMRLVLEI